MKANSSRTESALVISYHNWKSKRLGGFHKLAEAICLSGLDVDFVSFSRPYYGIFKADERINAKALWSLYWGMNYKIAERTLYNFTCPTIGLPRFVAKRLPEQFADSCQMTTFPSLAKRLQRRGRSYRFIILESTPCVRFYPWLKNLYPTATFVYRPSDPLTHSGVIGPDQIAEQHLLHEADFVFLINEASRDLYAKSYPEIDVSSNRFHIIPNGVDVGPYMQNWERPIEYRCRPTAVYVGAVKVDWDLVLGIAKQIPEVDICIVTPSSPMRHVIQQIKEQENIDLVPGVMPEEVPRYITNADVFIAPYKAGCHLRLVRMHAKILQAIAAQKPIVVANVSSELTAYGITIANDADAFAQGIRNAIASGPRQYPTVDLAALSWSAIQRQFINTLKI